MLDATAGNRMMWKNKRPPNVIFMDKEIRLHVPPDVFACWETLPFRDNSFKAVLFDPPHTRFGETSVHNNPGWDSVKGGRWWGRLPRRKIDWLVQFNKASKEFCRVAEILCFKWSETSHRLFPLLALFKPEWKIKQIKKHVSKYKMGKSDTWWVTFVRTSR